MEKSLLDVLKERRSVREFTSEPVTSLDVMQILEAGSWAPSIHNCQPWSGVIIYDADMKAMVSSLTKYSTIVAQSQVLLAIFSLQANENSAAMSHQSIGAAIQNMLLAADDLGLGAVWLGDLQESCEKIQDELGIGEKYRLAALVAIGYPAHRNQKSHRKHVNDFILKTIGG